MQQFDYWIVKRAQQSPNKIALIQMETQQAWTYAELIGHISWWCQRLRHFNVQPGDRVATLMENSIECFAIIFACRIQQALYVPLNTKLALPEQQFVLDDCTPSLLIADVEQFTRAQQLHNVTVIHAVSDCIEFQSFQWQHQPQLPWLLIYTGGTTGKAKGVILSYEAVTTNAVNTVLSWGLTDSDCTLNYMPLFHTGGINALALPILLAGGTVVIGKQFQPQVAIQALNDYNTTISLFVPTMYQLMIETAYFNEHTFPTVKVFLSGGAPCPKFIYNRFAEKDLPFKEGYGLTEAGPNNFVIDTTIAIQKKGAVGKSMLLNEVCLINDRGEQCANGEVGELCIRGSHVFSGYWNNDSETTKALQQGWLHTGDLARIDEEGDYRIVGRKKDVIITGGENVYPQEIEQCLLANSLVEEVAVIGMPHEQWGECVIAFIVSSEQNHDILHALCKERLANYKVPKQFHFIEALPKTAVGKIDKQQLIERAAMT